MRTARKIYHWARWHCVRAVHYLRGIPLDGERVSPLWRNDCFYSHLALYALAGPWMHGRTVIDAGSGAGYGSACLLSNGAQRVTGIDNDARTIAFCRRRYQAEGLDFQVGDISALPYTPGSFDGVFCSNALEHLATPKSFFHAVARVLGPGGVLFLAVPLIDEQTRDFNEQNPHHHSNLTPEEWVGLVREHFVHVISGSQYFCPRTPGRQFDLHNTPATTVITEADFVLTSREPGQMTWGNTMNVVFIASQQPIAPPLPSSPPQP